MAFERDKNWKKCPLCNESIYKHEIKGVKVIQNNDYKIGETIKFDLCVRSKASIIVKDKYIAGKESLKLPAMIFPF